MPEGRGSGTGSGCVHIVFFLRITTVTVIAVLSVCFEMPSPAVFSIVGGEHWLLPLQH